MTSKKENEIIESIENLLPQLYEFLGFIELSNYLNTEEMKFSKFTLLKAVDMLRFIVEDYEDILLENDPNDFLNFQDYLTKLKSCENGLYEVNREKLLKFIGYHIWRLESQLYDLKGGNIGSVFNCKKSKE